LDGTTKSPDSFSGPVGKKLNGKVSTWPVKNLNQLKMQICQNCLMILWMILVQINIMDNENA